MSETISTWNEVRRLADQLELEIHLAGMEARDRWAALKPRLRELEDSISHAGKRAGEVIDREIASIGIALKRLRDDVAPRSDD